MNATTTPPATNARRIPVQFVPDWLAVDEAGARSMLGGMSRRSFYRFKAAYPVVQLQPGNVYFIEALVTAARQAVATALIQEQQRERKARR